MSAKKCTFQVPNFNGCSRLFGGCFWFSGGGVPGFLAGVPGFLGVPGCSGVLVFLGVLHSSFLAPATQAMILWTHSPVGYKHTRIYTLLLKNKTNVLKILLTICCFMEGLKSQTWTALTLPDLTWSKELKRVNFCEWPVITCVKIINWT